MYSVSSHIGVSPTAVVVAHRLGDELVRRIRMDAQHRMWEQNLKNNSKLENAIAVIGFKAALIIGKSYSAF